MKKKKVKKGLKFLINPYWLIARTRESNSRPSRQDWDVLTKTKLRPRMGLTNCFKVVGGKQYQEAADKKSWQRLTEFLSVTLKI
jgi:hypothetical protein